MLTLESDFALVWIMSINLKTINEKFLFVKFLHLYQIVEKVKMTSVVNKIWNTTNLTK